MSAVKGGWAHENDRFNRRLQKMIAHRWERNLKDVPRRLPSGTTPADRSRHMAGPRNPSSLDFLELDVQRVRFGEQKGPKKTFLHEYPYASGRLALISMLEIAV
jgi:hypothetical protein